MLEDRIRHRRGVKTKRRTKKKQPKRTDGAPLYKNKDSRQRKLDQIYLIIFRLTGCFVGSFAFGINTTSTSKP